MPAVIWPDSCFIQQTFTLILCSTLKFYCLALAAGTDVVVVFIFMRSYMKVDCRVGEGKRKKTTFNLEQKCQQRWGDFTAISPTFWKPFSFQGSKFRSLRSCGMKNTACLKTDF